MQTGSLNVEIKRHHTLAKHTQEAGSIRHEE